MHRNRDFNASEKKKGEIRLSDPHAAGSQKTSGGCDRKADFRTRGRLENYKSYTQISRGGLNHFVLLAFWVLDLCHITTRGDVNLVLMTAPFCVLGILGWSLNEPSIC